MQTHVRLIWRGEKIPTLFSPVWWNFAWIQFLPVPPATQANFAPPSVSALSPRCFYWSHAFCKWFWIPAFDPVIYWKGSGAKPLLTVQGSWVRGADVWERIREKPWLCCTASSVTCAAPLEPFCPDSYIFRWFTSIMELFIFSAASSNLFLRPPLQIFMGAVAAAVDAVHFISSCFPVLLCWNSKAGKFRKMPYLNNAKHIILRQGKGKHRCFSDGTQQAKQLGGVSGTLLR